MKKINFLFLFCSILLLAGCAAAPVLENYPQRQIDRPFTLLKGVATWSTIVATGVLQNNTSSTAILPIPVPLFWATSLSDDWELLWVPLPLAVKHQLSYTKNGWLGLTFVLPVGVNNASQWTFEPNATLSYRSKMTQDWALENSLGGAVGIPFQGGSVSWSLDYGFGPFFQVRDNFAIKPFTGVGLAQGYVSEGFEYVSSAIAIPTSLDITVPIGMKLFYNLGRQWDLNGGYRFSSLVARSNGFLSHVVHAELKYFW